MKLALISEIHANLEALQAALDDIAPHSVDRIVCLGDIVGYNTKPQECIALLREVQAVCVAGNHDRAVCGQITTELQQYRRARRRLDMQARDEWRSQLPCHSSA